MLITQLTFLFFLIENSSSQNFEGLEGNTSRRRTWQQPEPLKFNACFTDDTGSDKSPSPTSPGVIDGSTFFKLYLKCNLYST